MSVQEITVRIDLDGVIVKDEEGYSVHGAEAGNEIPEDRLQALYEKHTTAAHQGRRAGGCRGTGIIAAEVAVEPDDPGTIFLRIVSNPAEPGMESITLAQVALDPMTASRLGDALEFAARLPGGEAA